MPRALTIAGSDSGGGAGIQADLKTFTSLKVYGSSVITAITAQNTLGIARLYDLPVNLIELQLNSVITDIGCDSVKIGMLSNNETVELISNKIAEYKLQKIVLDPVIESKGGTKLLKEDAINSLKNNLIPKSFIITPNVPEAELLANIPIRNIKDMKKAARELIKLKCKNVLIKGGHLPESKESIDILYDGNNFFEFSSKRITTKNTHGTGCTYSAAISANLAKGMNALDAVEHAKIYITQAISNSFDIGKGSGPLNHFWNI
ncbi:MAG: bifunctional hydroxymethylpyrimidine kinase/phosphomethylpyrimidine kinase [Candidatus Dadabacteria bacterium]|nr:bifunctional hydroxymethylpyrimidine kinase/phosphomethylpyrimidine kinase [Candidatus Dadabacteria bacterium]NIQ15255.1 bifunctional hydroxymethylpyrimidine kinase/phosphomethylpyrimidine kinase [Candidatus Dadabacteria bacterium]